MGRGVPATRARSVEWLDADGPDLSVLRLYRRGHDASVARLSPSPRRRRARDSAADPAPRSPHLPAWVSDERVPVLHVGRRGWRIGPVVPSASGRSSLPLETAWRFAAHRTRV